MAVAITRTADPASVAVDGSNNTTYSTVSIGTASSDRIIAVVIGKEASTTIPVTVNIDSGGGAQAMTFIGTVFGIVGAYIAYLQVPTGTTATIVINWSFAGLPSELQNHISVYSVTGANYPPSYTGNDTSSDMDATDPLTTGSTVIAVGGGMLAVAAGATHTAAKAWANLTEDLDVVAGNFRHTTAFSTTAGTATRTCTGTTNGEDGVMAWAHFAQLTVGSSVIPFSRAVQKPVRPNKVNSLLSFRPLTQELLMPPFKPR